jgi:acetyltransferase
VPGIIGELGRRGARAAVVITAGVRDDLQRAMLEAARPWCLRIQGPNCLGLMVPGRGLNAGFSHEAPIAGDLAFLSQSGALITAIIDWARGHRIGFSHVVSLGDMADADFGDLLDYLAADARSRAILIYMEAVTHARKFLSAARRAARAKPVIVVKAGREAAGARAALSHTGALAGADAAYEAAFRRAGVLRVRELQDLFSAAEILARHPRLAGERLAILTNGGGAGVLAADRLAELDGRLATLSGPAMAALDAALPPTWSHGNPVDIVGDAGPARYARALDVLLKDPASDAVLVVSCPTALASSTAVADEVVATLEGRNETATPQTRVDQLARRRGQPRRPHPICGTRHCQLCHPGRGHRRLHAARPLRPCAGRAHAHAGLDAGASPPQHRSGRRNDHGCPGRRPFDTVGSGSEGFAALLRDPCRPDRRRVQPRRSRHARSALDRLAWCVRGEDPFR